MNIWSSETHVRHHRAAQSGTAKKRAAEATRFSNTQRPVSCRQPIQQTARQKGEQRFTLISIVPFRWGNRPP